jgi:hypothetical protein
MQKCAEFSELKVREDRWALKIKSIKSTHYKQNPIVQSFHREKIDVALKTETGRCGAGA